MTLLILVKTAVMQRAVGINEALFVLANNLSRTIEVLIISLAVIAVNNSVSLSTAGPRAREDFERVMQLFMASSYCLESFGLMLIIVIKRSIES